MEFRFAFFKCRIVTETMGEQQISCSIKAVADMLCMMRVASDGDNFSSGVLVHFQDICMRMRERETTV